MPVTAKALLSNAGHLYIITKEFSAFVVGQCIVLRMRCKKIILYSAINGHKTFANAYFRLILARVNKLSP